MSPPRTESHGLTVTRIEALGFRTLRYVSQRLGPFHVLVGPNASGKSAFLDVLAFLGDLHRVDLEHAIMGYEPFGIPRRATDPRHLTWMRRGKTFELAVEAAVPDVLRERLQNGAAGVCRYEIAVDVSEPYRIARETLWLKPEEEGAGAERERPRFPNPPEPPEGIVADPEKRAPARWRRVAVRESNPEHVTFRPETTDDPAGDGANIARHSVKNSKKLIEVALPLDAINAASVREKSIRHGHPSTLHLWWARRPLAAARAVIFSQIVDDPSAHPDRFPTEKAQAQERERLFGIIEKLVKWENTNDEKVLEQAREEIRESWLRTCTENADHPRAAELFDPDRLPAFHDPFAGGGALPLEAQRLGLEAHASDLNPVAVLINKAMIEIPPRFAGRAPVNPNAQAELARGGRWNGKGAQGLAEDVRYYGQWMRDEAEKRIGHLYPKIEVTAAMAAGRPALERYVGRKLTVIAWLWARTVKSPNPAFAHVDVPLASTFMLSTKKGKEAYVEPVVEGGGYRFTVKDGAPEAGASEAVVPEAGIPRNSAPESGVSKVGGPEAGASEAGIPEAGIPRNDAPESGVPEDGVPGNAGVPPPSSSFPRKRESMRPENGVSREDTGVPPAQGTKLGRGANFRCLMSDAPIPGDYIKAEGRAGRMGARLMAIVTEGDRGRVYLAPTVEQETAARKAAPEWRPEGDVPTRLTGGTCVPYGLTTWGDLFTPRQLAALTTFSDLVQEAIARIKQDVLETRPGRPLEENASVPPAFPRDDLPLRDGGTGATAYAEAIGGV